MNKLNLVTTLVNFTNKAKYKCKTEGNKSLLLYTPTLCMPAGYQHVHFASLFVRMHVNLPRSRDYRQ